MAKPFAGYSLHLKQFILEIKQALQPLPETKVRHFFL